MPEKKRKSRRFKEISIEIHPDDVHRGCHIVSIEVEAQGRKAVYRERMPENHFESLFDRLMEDATKKIKKELFESE